MMNKSNMGSHVTGISFSRAKFTAFASDWEQTVLHFNTPVLFNGVQVIGWDNSKAGIIVAIVVRAYGDTTENIFGKRGTFSTDQRLQFWMP